MAEGSKENDDNSDHEENHVDVDNFSLNELNLGLGNGQLNIDTMVHAYTQEYENLDHTLDELDVWMNKIEQQNDSLNSQLDDLLQSSIQARKELQEQNAGIPDDRTDDDDDRNSGSDKSASNLNESNSETATDLKTD